MAARPIASATISFGLVSVPVKLYSAGEPGRRISFNLLHDKCGTRLKQQYVCPKDGEKVARNEMVKGYEFAKDQYVKFTGEELKAIEEQATQSMNITEFVLGDQVDRIYIDKAYYLGPDKGGDRAYRLLSAALAKTGRVAIAKYAARGKQYLVMLRPKDEGLIMEQLLYPQEVKPFSEVPLGEAEVKSQELDLAVQLIEQAAGDVFAPDEFKDEVQQRMLDLIQQKVEGKEITVQPTEEPQTQIIDLMEALKASIAGGTGGEEAERKPATRVTKKSKKRASASKRKKASA